MFSHQQILLETRLTNAWIGDDAVFHPVEQVTLLEHYLMNVRPVCHREPAVFGRRPALDTLSVNLTRIKPIKVDSRRAREDTVEIVGILLH